jgi:hypothetical protein
MAPRRRVHDRLAIRDLLEKSAVWRDAADWERFSTVWHEGGRMMTTWFQGTGDEFIKVSRERFNHGVRIQHFWEAAPLIAKEIAQLLRQK